MRIEISSNSKKKKVEGTPPNRLNYSLLDKSI